MKDEILVTILLVALLTAFAGGLYAAQAAWKYYLTYGYEVVVKDGDNLIYEGPAACVVYSSVGAATTVRVMRPFLYCSLFQKKEIVSNNITVETKQ
jgi:hypothetical protein